MKINMIFLRDRKKTRVCEDEIYVHIHIRMYVHAHVSSKLLQSCSTLCDHMYCIPPGSSVQGIHQARILECVALPPDPRIKSVSPVVPALHDDSLPLSQGRVNLGDSLALGVHGFSYWESMDLAIGRNKMPT